MFVKIGQDHLSLSSVTEANTNEETGQITLYWANGRERVFGPGETGYTAVRDYLEDNEVTVKTIKPNFKGKKRFSNEDPRDYIQETDKNGL